MTWGLSQKCTGRWGTSGGSYRSIPGAFPNPSLRLHEQAVVASALRATNSRCLLGCTHQERKHEVPASTRDEALIHCTKPSGVQRGPSQLHSTPDFSEAPGDMRGVSGVLEGSGLGKDTSLMSLALAGKSLPPVPPGKPQVPYGLTRMIREPMELSEWLMCQ